MSGRCVEMIIRVAYFGADPTHGLGDLIRREALRAFKNVIE
jgi:hypothetical protein